MDPQDNKKGNKLKVSVKDKRLCPRYTAISVSGIEIKDSPKWIQDRLSAVGSRPINNIVDITNYVMLELGQPLHAFDASLVDNIIVRQTKKDEQIETLDGRMRELEPGMLVIADSEKPIAIAGIMGGDNSEISEKTSEIILEAANFEPVQIRKTANKLSLRTDASSCVRIANPINENQALLRSSLVSGLLENIHKNQARFNSLSFFEIGSIFLNLEGDIAKETSGKEKLPYQEKRLGMIFAGTKTEEEFYYGKGCLEFLFSKLNLNFFFDLSETAPNWANNQIYAKIYVEKQEIGYICALKNETQKKMGLKKQLIISEINFIKLFQIVNTRSEKKYKQTEKFPQVSRDLAFVINNKILYNNIMEEILNSHEYVRAVELFDVYKEENLGKSNKSMAFHIAYQADKTLEAKEIDSLQKELIKKLEKKFNAKVRDF